MTRVLVLTADAGFGHRSAAQALAAVMDERDDCEYSVVNVLDHPRTPAWLRDAQSDYDRIAREAAELYRFTYEISDSSFVSRMMENALRVILYRAVREVVLDCRPDVVVSTYPLYMAPLSALAILRQLYIPSVCVVTDLATVHKIWFSGDPDILIVPTSIVRDLAEDAGIPSSCIDVVGIPVHPRIARAAAASGGSADKRARKAAMGMREDLPAALAAGSKRVGAGLLSALDALNHSMIPLQLALVAGGDEALHKEFLRREWHPPTTIRNFANDMPELLCASDLVLAKAGGLIVTESLAAGLPILIVGAIPGQETGNADYVVSGGAGKLVRGGNEALEAVFHLLAEGGKGLAAMSEAARALGRPRAAYDIVERALGLSKRGPRKREPATPVGLARLRELFSRFGVVPED